MKILLVTTKGTTGGAQVFVSDLARSLVKRGHEVRVAAGDGDFLPADLRRDNIVFRRLKSLSSKLGLGSLIRFSFELRHLVLEYRPDVVHFNSSHVLMGALLISLMSKRPKLVFTMHGLSILDPNYEQAGIKKLLFWRVYSFFLRRLDQTIYICQKNLSDRPCLVKSGSSVIYNGIDLKKDFISRQVARQEISRLAGQDLNNSFIFASIGRLAYQKNYEFLIRSWSKVLQIKPASCLVIFGQGELEEKLRALVKEYQLGASIFIINLAPASLYLLGADFYLQSSRYEGLPYSIFEAMQARLPILASEVGGIKEMLVSAEQLFPLNDEQTFLTRLKNALENTTQTAQIIKDNYERLDLFSLEKMTEEYLDIYQKI